MRRALVVGDLFLVYSAPVRRLPVAGENFLLSGVRTDCSGVGANIATDLVRLGIPTDVFGAVGRDASGTSVVDGLRRAGVGTRLIKRRTGFPTGTFVIIVDRRRERTMIGFRGASQTVKLASGALGDATPGWVHVSGYSMLNPGQVSLFAKLVSAARHRGIPVSVDLEGVAQARRKIDLGGVRVFCNLLEYRAYFGRDRIVNDFGATSLVVKAGSRGAYLAGGQGAKRVPGFEAETVDSTGAGDAFNAGFIKAKLGGADDYEACVWGNACGSLKVAKEGPFLQANAAVVGRLARRTTGQQLTRETPTPRKQ